MSGGFLSRVKAELVALRHTVHRRAYMSRRRERSVVDDFHLLFHDSYDFQGTWAKTTWLGTPVLKCPFDLWVYQEIIHELRPDLILECGTAHGGSAHYMASLLDLIGKGRILTVDIAPMENRPEHERIEYLNGSSTAPEIVEAFRTAAADAETVLLVLDSDHSRDHVLEELRLYSDLVTPGSYVIVEDTNINGHPVMPEFGPGPMEAVEEFLRANRNFVVDREREKLYITFSPSGYLKRMR